MLIHETTYGAKAGVASRVHRARLKRELEVLNSLVLPKTGRLADFGCSNGFLLDSMQRGVPRLQGWECVGFDRKSELLDLAEKRQLPRTAYRQLDLNVSHDVGRFDLITCFETLEHVGDYQSAVRNLLRACADGGHLVISVPYEIGMPGLVKFLGRMALRKNPYHDFFDNRSKLRYLLALLFRRPMDAFRQPAQNGWSVHLGFDNGVFEAFLFDELSDWSLVIRRTSFLGFNVIYAFQRTGKRQVAQQSVVH